MNFNNLTTNFVKASPYIAFGAGVVSLGGAIFTAIRATMALEEVLDEYEEQKKEIDLYLENCKEEGAVDNPETLVIIEENCRESRRKLFLGLIGKGCKLYAPTAGFTLASVGCFGYAAGKYRAMYLTTAGAFTELSNEFDGYRGVVRDDVGEEKELEYYYGGKREKITVEETDEETGKTKKVKKDILVDAKAGEFSYEWKQYDWQTGEGSTQWDPSAIYGKNYIIPKIRQFQNNLDAGKNVNFDRLLDELGYEESNRKGDKDELRIKAAKEHMAGWLPGDKIECGLEDHYYDKFQDVRDFMDENNPNVVLRFNPRRDILGYTTMGGIK